MKIRGHENKYMYCMEMMLVLLYDVSILSFVHKQSFTFGIQKYCPVQRNWTGLFETYD